MSKCKAVLDGEKITEIRVKTKPKDSRKNASGTTGSDDPKRPTGTTSKQPK